MTDEENAPPVAEVAPAEVVAVETLPQETSPPTEAQSETPEVSAESISEPSSPQSRTEPAPPSVGSSGLPAATSLLRTQALEARHTKMRNREDSIVALAKEKKSITNKDVQLHCRVSDPTATRDFELLVKDGSLTRVGKQKRPKYEPA